MRYEDWFTDTYKADWEEAERLAMAASPSIGFHLGNQRHFFEKARTQRVVRELAAVDNLNGAGL